MKSKFKKILYSKTGLDLIILYAFYLYRLRGLLGFKTKGYSQTKVMAFYRMMALQKAKNMSVARSKSVASGKVNRELHNWAIREPDKHITVAFSVEERKAALVIGANYQPYFDDKEMEEVLSKANLLLADEQFLKGIDYLIKYTTRKLNNI